MMQMGELVKKGVDVYLLRSMPVIFVVVVVVASVVWVTAGGPFVISMLVGASTCMFCANLGTNMNFEGIVDELSGCDVCKEIFLNISPLF